MKPEQYLVKSLIMLILKVVIFLSFPNILALAYVKDQKGKKCREVRCPSFSCSGVCRFSSLEVYCYNFLAEQETDDKTVFFAILC